MGEFQGKLNNPVGYTRSETRPVLTLAGFSFGFKRRVIYIDMQNNNTHTHIQTRFVGHFSIRKLLLRQRDIAVGSLTAKHFCFCLEHTHFVLFSIIHNLHYR